MNVLHTPARVALAAVTTGAFFGAVLHVATEAFGASIGSMVLPVLAMLIAAPLGRWLQRGRLPVPGDSDAAEPSPAMPPASAVPETPHRGVASAAWFASALATAFLLAGHIVPELLGATLGWASLPRWTFPAAWVGVAALAAHGPAAFSITASPLRALGAILGMAIGLWAPLPATAVLVGVGTLWAPLAPVAAKPSATWIEHALTHLALVGGGAMAVQAAVVVQPTLDPSPAPVLAALAAAVVGFSVAHPRVRWGPWPGWLLLGVAGLAVAGILPHTVGITRLIHIQITGALGPGLSPSIGPALFGAFAGLTAGTVGAGILGNQPTLRASTALAAGFGLLLGTQPVPATGTTGVVLAGVVVGVTLLLASQRLHQGAGLVLAGALAAVVWRGTSLPLDALLLSPLEGLRSAEAWEAHLVRAVDQVPGQAPLTARGTGVVTAAPEDWRATGSSLALLPFEADLAGRITRPTGRAAEAEVMAGLLAGLLAPRLDRVLVLNDDSGNALAGLSSAEPAAIDIATPVPHTVQDIARLAPSRRDRWLAPGVRLWPEHPASVLRRAPTPAAIVDIAHGGWHDSVHAPPTPAHFAAVHRQLGTYGVYVLCLHLGSLRPGEPAAIADSLAHTFGRVQIWLPPTGADSMLLVASENTLSLARLEDRVGTMLPTLRQLGFPNAAAIGSMAIADAQSVSAWQQESALPSSWWLDPASRSRPSLHLSALAPHLAPVDRTWDLTGATTGAAALTGRLDARRRFLELLGDAARGDVASALDKARGLASEDGGERALRALVGPHLDSARKALALASREGPSSGAWADVHRYATTARMIAPTSAEPLVLLGMMSLAQGDLSGAQAHFAEAEQLADGDLDALTGLARVARLRRDSVAAERYFREAATANPREWVAWHRLGVFLTENQRTDEAETVLERAASLAAGASPAPNLALARMHLQTGRSTTGLVHAERALVVGASAEGYFLRGLAYLQLDQLDNAERDFRQTVLTDPTFAAAHVEIGRIRAVRGDPAAAEAAWRAVLRIEPNNANARENLRRLGLEARATPSPPPD